MDHWRPLGARAQGVSAASAAVAARLNNNHQLRSSDKTRARRLSSFALLLTLQPPNRCPPPSAAAIRLRQMQTGPTVRLAPNMPLAPSRDTRHQVVDGSSGIPARVLLTRRKPSDVSNRE